LILRDPDPLTLRMRGGHRDHLWCAREHFAAMLSLLSLKARSSVDSILNRVLI
jgi:hypothetical protein